jgi:hypothetical protein
VCTIHIPREVHIWISCQAKFEKKGLKLFVQSTFEKIRHIENPLRRKDLKPSAAPASFHLRSFCGGVILH